MNNPNNNLTQEQKKELEKLLGEIEVPRAHHYLPQIGNQTKDIFNTGLVEDKAVHAHVGWNADESNQGNGAVYEQSKISFGKGDDIVEVRTGFGVRAELNLGAGNDELIIHGKAPSAISAIFWDNSGRVNGGQGYDKITLKAGSSHELHVKTIPNFNEVVMDGTNGKLIVSKDDLASSLGNERRLIVRQGANGTNNTVQLTQPGRRDNWSWETKTETENDVTYKVYYASGSSNKQIWVEQSITVN